MNNMKPKNLEEIYENINNSKNYKSYIAILNESNDLIRNSREILKYVRKERMETDFKRVVYVHNIYFIC